MAEAFFGGLSDSIAGVVGLSLVSAVVMAASILGAVVAFRVYKRLLG